MVIAKWRRLESLVLHKTKQKFNMTSTEAIKRKGKQHQGGNETERCRDRPEYLMIWPSQLRALSAKH